MNIEHKHYSNIIICTYNRAKSLRDTLEALMEQSLPDDVSAEVIVVDNNCSDETKSVIEDFTRHAKKIPIRYVFEIKQGISFARNAGIKSAKGDFIIFTDDDVIPEKGWCFNLCEAYKKNPDVDIFGGPVRPLWEIKPARWLEDPELISYLALVDYGDQIIKKSAVTPNFLVGANFAFKKTVFDEIGNFDTRLGSVGCERYLGDDTDMMKRAFEAGKRAMYIPNALVHHKVPKERMKLKYFRHWWFRAGYSYVKLSVKFEKLEFWLLRECVQEALKYLICIVSFKAVQAIKAEKEFWYKCGMVSALWKR